MLAQTMMMMMTMMMNLVMEVGTHRCKLLLWLVNFGNLATEEKPMVVAWIREGMIRGDIWGLTTGHLW